MPHPPEEPREDRAVWVHRLTTLFVWGVLLVLFIQFFPAVRMLLLGVLAAACLAAAVRPIQKRMPGNRGLRAAIAGLIPVLVFATLLFAIGWAMRGPIREQMGQWPQVRDRLNQTLDKWGQRIGVPDAPDVAALADYARTAFMDQGGLSTTTNALSVVLIALAFIFFGSIFILTERERSFLEPVLRLLPPRRRPQVLAMVDDLEPKLRWWLIGTMISMVVVGVLSYVGYRLAGLEFALPLALLAGLAEIVPTVGPTIAFVVALGLGLSQGPSAAVGVTIVYVVVQAIESYVLLPYVMKKTVKIPPVVTLFTVVLWGKVFGAAGLFLAIPIDLVIWSALTHFVAPKDEPDSDKMQQKATPAADA